MKGIFSFALIVTLFSSMTFAASSGASFGGPLGADWGTSSLGPVAENIAFSDTYDVTNNLGLTNEEVEDIESLIFLIIEKQNGTLDLTAKDVMKARNMQRTYMLATMIPKTGANPIAVTNVFPAELPATGSSGRNIFFLFVALLGMIGLMTTVLWRK